MEEVKPTTKSTNWCGTWNNYDEHSILVLKSMGASYGVVGKEVGESGTPHLQIFLHFDNSRTFSSMNNKCQKKCWWKPKYKKARTEDSINYCKKGEQSHEEYEKYKTAGENYGKNADITEWGTPPTSQGVRNDLDQLRNEILEGRSVDEIAVEDPMAYHFYNRTMHRIEDLRMRKTYRNFMTEGEWIYGETGTGKSEYAFKDFNPETHYVWAYERNGWNDGYTQQDTVILDEFRGQVCMNELLRMVDKHPNYFVARRGREPLPFVSKRVIITSALHPKEVFKNLEENDKLEQLLRRFKITKFVR